MTKPGTVGELRASGYKSKSVKQELRDNLVVRLKAGAELFPSIVGYEDTVLPQIEDDCIGVRHKAGEEQGDAYQHDEQWQRYRPDDQHP